MLSRYTIYRHRPRGAPPLPDGIRKDSRWRTRHILRPTGKMVESYLANPTDEAWKHFRQEYLAVLEERRAESPDDFDNLAALAASADVFIGCSCPTAKQPNVKRCHTWLALQFMEEKYPNLTVIYPETPQ